ncbi:MAG: hypothetical protein A3F13_04595 [Gammaproteobacteria bacterium RIFCSPHIGHO2_12_FULL_40_19]|nr:MAG: hypothetical protein A3F13_04595 [Gammaproteobacteria bacterium RIFCSPHIGHO2_12_FULL_40_19]
MLRSHKTLKTSLALFGLLSSVSALAVNGAFDYGFSEITRGMGGAGSALPEDTLIAAINPAGMVDVGKRMDLGAILYFPTMSYNASSFTPSAISSLGVAPGLHNSSVGIFALPDFGINFPLNQQSALGVSLYSLGGFGTQYKSSNTATVAVPGVGAIPALGPMGGGTLLSDLKQAVTSVTYSRKFLSNSSFGLSLLLGLQTLRAEGAGGLSTLSANPNNISNKGADYSAGAGARLGFLFGVLPDVNLSVSYQPKMIMSKFHQYSGLLSNAGEFDIPAYGNIGAAWHISETIALVGDVEEIWFKDIPAYGTNNAAIVPGGSCIPSSLGSTCLGGSNGAGFGWGNDTVYKVGAEWQVTEKTALRAGYNRSDQILSSLQATENMITPGALIQNILTLGATQKISKKDAINGVFTFIPKQTFTAQNLFSGAANQTVTTAAQGFGFGASWSRILD